MIKNHKILASTGAREKVLSILEKGVEAALPENVVKNSVKLKNGILTILDKEFKLKEYKNVFVIGGGKASYKMAEALNRIIGERISYGYVNSTANAKVGKITINKAGHPKPDDKGVLGVKKMLSINPSKDDMAICLISGGGSAMMPLPVKSISLEDLRKTNGLLLKAGATIFEVNTVRKHLSQISGGRLAAELYPATVISLIISDVMGDELSVIASGPTVADKTCFKDAMIIIEDYGMADKVPKSVTEHLLLGVDGKAEETVKEGDERIGRVYNFVIANNITALKAMEEEAQNQGLKPQIVNPAVNGEAREAGVVIAEEVLKAKSGSALIFGGETTVTVKGNGIGGRNQEMILSMVDKIKDSDVTIASLGTDGIDFYKVAGAIADGKSYEKAKKLKLDIKKSLNNNDSYNFFKKMKDGILTGYTGTNVCDIIVGVKVG